MNEGRSQHDVTADDGSFASAELGPGEAFAETFATEGAYPYFCSIHGSPGAGMTGLILVGDDRARALTAVSSPVVPARAPSRPCRPVA